MTILENVAVLEQISLLNTPRELLRRRWVFVWTLPPRRRPNRLQEGTRPQRAGIDTSPGPVEGKLFYC